MARSSGIWIVCRKETKTIAHGWFEDGPGEILGTFTVKHEMITSIACSKESVDNLMVLKLADGHFSTPGILSEEEIKYLVDERRSCL